MAGEFDVYLQGFRPDAQDGAVESLQQLFGVDAGFARTMLASLPRSVKTGVSLETAERYIGLLESIGGIAQLRPAGGVEDLLPPIDAVAASPAFEPPPVSPGFGPAAASAGFDAAPVSAFEPPPEPPAFEPPPETPAFEPPSQPASAPRPVDPFAPPEAQQPDAILELADAPDLARPTAGAAPGASPARSRVDAAISPAVAVSGGQAVRAVPASIATFAVVGCILAVIALRLFWVGGGAVEYLVGYSMRSVEPQLRGLESSTDEIDPRDDSPVADRFGETQEAQSFLNDPSAAVWSEIMTRAQVEQLVERLYEIGAIHVMFGLIEEVDGRRVSATLIAELPAATVTRGRLIQLWNASTGASIADNDQDYLVVRMD